MAELHHDPLKCSLIKQNGGDVSQSVYKQSALMVADEMFLYRTSSSANLPTADV